MGFMIKNIVELKDVAIIEPFLQSDNRGKFGKFYEKSVLYDLGIRFSIQEVFVTKSNKNVIRGLHFQYANPQSKLITVLNGSCRDVLVDLRKNSPTYMKHMFFDLTDISGSVLYIPKGFAHGFISLTDNMTMMYMCDEKYDKNSDAGILYNDSDLNIDWGDEADKFIHSDRDLKLLTVKEFEKLNLFVNL